VIFVADVDDGDDNCNVLDQDTDLVCYSFYHWNNS